MQLTGQEVPHDPSWSRPLQMYVIIHFLLALGTYQDAFDNKMVCICPIRQTVNVKSTLGVLLKEGVNSVRLKLLTF